MAAGRQPPIDYLQLALEHAWPLALSVIAVATIAVVAILRCPIAKALEGFAARGGKLPGGIELNAEVTVQSQSTALAPSNEARTFDTVTQALLGPVIEERTRAIDQNLRTLTEAERYRGLLVAVARDQVALEFHRLYRFIYGSQITLLKLANQGGTIVRSGAEGVYHAAVGREPEFYKQTTFEQWISFLLNQLLLQPGAADQYQLTNRGQLFLHFIVQEGLSDYGLPHNANR